MPSIPVHGVSVGGGWILVEENSSVAELLNVTCATFDGSSDKTSVFRVCFRFFDQKRFLMCYENYLHTLCSILGNLLKVQGVLLSSCQSRMYDRPRRGIVELPASPWYLINHLKQCDIYLHILLYLGLIVIIEGM